MYVHVYKTDPSSSWDQTSSPAAHGSSGLPLAHTDTHKWMSLVQSSGLTGNHPPECTNSPISSCNPLVSVTPKPKTPMWLNLQAPYTWFLASYPIHQLIGLDLHYCLHRHDTNGCLWFRAVASLVTIPQNAPTPQYPVATPWSL